jgi:regulator of protease activity HflC (stomatin/prohibitin superfamily)
MSSYNSSIVNSKKFRDRLGAEVEEKAVRVAAEEEKKQEQIRANDKARAERIAGINAEKRKAQEAAENAIDNILEPEKLRERNRYLYERPGLTDDDFEKQWAILRPNYVAELEKSHEERGIAALKATGAYRL